ncbi:MAG: STN domain-containing protein, partial [Allomuricauda sp.]
MRFLTLFLLLFTLYSYTDAYSQKTKLKVDLKDATLLDIIYSIEGQSEFVFMYGEDLLPALNQKKGDFKIKNQTIDNALEQHFKPNRIDYHINGRQIVLKKNVIQSKTPIKEEGLQMAVSGTVTDD